MLPFASACNFHTKDQEKYFPAYTALIPSTSSELAALLGNDNFLSLGYLLKDLGQVCPRLSCIKYLYTFHAPIVDRASNVFKSDGPSIAFGGNRASARY